MIAQADPIAATFPTDIRPWAFSWSYCIIAFSTLCHLAYLFVCPLDLSPDEAHYWDWSRHLDWCYYSKGPLVAWLIRASTEMFGHSAAAVRLPAVGCHLLLLLAVYRLVVEVLGKRSALRALLLAATLPPVAAGATLLTIDAPFLAAWAWALVFARRAVIENRGWAAAGACVAVGLLAKPTMLVFPGLVAGYMLFGRSPVWFPPPLRGRVRVGGARSLDHPRLPAAICSPPPTLTLPRKGGGNKNSGWPGLTRLLAVAALGLLPLLLWNAANDWVGLRHVAVQAGAADGPKVGFHWWRPLETVAGQAAALGYWFFAWLLAVRHYPADPNRRFLWWSSVPVIAVVLVAGLRAKAQPNWGLPAYIGGFVLIVDWLNNVLAGPAGRWRSLVRNCLVGGIALSLILSGIAHFPQVAAPVFEAVAPSPTEDDPAPVHKLDPTARLRGWQYLAQEVDRVRDRVRQESGADPEVAAMVWTVPGELGFYGRGTPQVYSFGTALADRHSQYDVWRPNPVADAQAFRGRSFVYVGEIDETLIAAFETIDPAERLVYRENGVPMAAWAVRVCRKFRGFPGVPTPKY